MEIQWPAHQQRLGHDVAKPRNLRIAHRAGVMVEMTADLISRTTSQNGQLPHPSASPELASAWSTLYRYKGVALNEVSLRLEDPTPANKGYAFLRICDVLSSEVICLPCLLVPVQSDANDA